jgi:uncharacterized lipoprotein YddW (UPF0748 family)
LQIDTVVSHGDWFNGWGTYGTPSVYRILSEIKRAGVRKVYWRTFFGARAMYQSALEPAYSGDEMIDRPGNEQIMRMRYDLVNWDLLKDAVTISRELALPIFAWYTLYEETHYQLKTTRFAEQHPEFWYMARDGRRRPSKLSFAAPEVRAHKLAMINEQLAYNVDGLCLDFFREYQLYETIKTPRVEVDEDGVSVYGYEPVMRDAFRRETGVDPLTLPNNDPDWLQFRADQVTTFMRDLHKVMRERALPLSVKVRSMNRIRSGYNWLPERSKTNSVMGSFADWPTWSKEGLVDEVMLIMENWDLFELDPRDIWTEVEAAKTLLGSGTKLNLGFFMNNMHDRSVRDGERWLDRCANTAIQAGADSVCLWESTGIHGWGSGRGGGSGTSIGLWSEVRRLATA